MNLLNALQTQAASISALTASSSAYTTAVAQAYSAPVNDRTTQQDTVTISDAAMQAYRAAMSSDGDSDGS